MRTIIFIILLGALFLSCSKDNPTEPEQKTPTSNSDFFFPLKQDNKWNYYIPGHRDGILSYRVWKTFTIQDSLFYVYGNKEATSDTLYQNQWGRVYKRRSNKNLMWLDFSLDDGATFQYKLSEKLNYKVTVKKNLPISYDDMKFENCMQFSFDVPDIDDEEMIYTLAPDIGIIQILGAWTTYYLDSYELK